MNLKTNFKWKKNKKEEEQDLVDDLKKKMSLKEEESITYFSVLGSTSNLMKPVSKEDYDKDKEPIHPQKLDDDVLIKGGKVEDPTPDHEKKQDN